MIAVPVPRSVAAALLGWAAATDDREITEEKVEAWAQQLADVVTPADGKQAINEHYATTTDWLKPAHVNTGVKRIRGTRISKQESPQPPASLDGDPVRERAWITARNTALGNGEDLELAEAIACRAVGVRPDPPVIEPAARPPDLLVARLAHGPQCDCGCLTKPIRPGEGDPR